MFSTGADFEIIKYVINFMCNHFFLILYTLTFMLDCVRRLFLYIVESYFLHLFLSGI